MKLMLITYTVIIERKIVRQSLDMKLTRDMNKKSCIYNTIDSTKYKQRMKKKII